MLPTEAVPRAPSTVTRTMRRTGDAENRASGCWELWKNIAKQHASPSDIRRSSAPIPQRPTGSPQPSPPPMTRSFPISRRSASAIREAASVVTGGIVSCQDSKWLLSWTINRQGQFKDPGEGRCLRLGIRSLHRCAGRLHQEADEGMHR